MKVVTLRQLVAFAGVGGIAAAIHLMALWILVDLMSFTPQAGNPCAFVLAFGASLVGHKRYTWPCNKIQLGIALRWLMVSLTGFGLNQLLYMLGLLYLQRLHYLVLFTIVTLVAAAITFLLGKYWAFVKH